MLWAYANRIAFFHATWRQLLGFSGFYLLHPHPSTQPTYRTSIPTIGKCFPVLHLHQEVAMLPPQHCGAQVSSTKTSACAMPPTNQEVEKAHRGLELIGPER